MTFLWREGSQASNLFGKAFPVVAKYIAQSSLFTGNFPLLGPLTGEAGLKSNDKRNATGDCGCITPETG